MPRPFRLACRTSCHSACREIPAKGSVRRWLLVRTLGRELRLRHQRCAASPRNRFAYGERILPARGELAARRPKSRRQLRRITLELHRSGHQGARKQYGFANRLGPDRLARRRRASRSGNPERGCLSCPPAEYRWFVERIRFHRHWFSRSLLFEVPPLPKFFPALRTRAIPNQVQGPQEYCSM